MGRLPLDHVFGGLRDGYKAEAQRFFAALRAELEDEARVRGPVGSVVEAVRRVNGTVPAWLADAHGRLQRDLERATEGILQERGCPLEEAQQLVASFSAGEGPWSTPWPLEPLHLPAPRAAIAGLRRGSGAALLLWLLTWAAVPLEQRDWGYLLSVLVGLSLGLQRFQRVRTLEARSYREAIDRYLHGAGSQVGAAIDHHVTEWVRAVHPRLARPQGEGKAGLPGQPGEGVG